MKLIGIAAIIASLVLAWYVLWYIPQQNIKQENDAKSASINAQLQKNQKQQDLNSCLSIADSVYPTEWATDCKANAVRVANGYQGCLGENLGTSFCLSTWGQPDSSTTCSLPSTLANSVTNDLENAKQDCYKHFPQ